MTAAKNATIRSARFNANIEYNPHDPVRFNMNDCDEEILTFWGIDEEGTCYFITFEGGVLDDTQTEEA